MTTHYITTEDMLSLSAFRFLREPSDDVVLLIHGLTTSTDMFVMPEHYNVVDYLLDHGYPEVWSLDFRMSNRHSYNMRRHSFTLDDVALYDFPAAIAKVREHDRRPAPARDLPLPRRRLVHDVPVRRGRHGHHQRDRQQRGPHAEGAALVGAQAGQRRRSWSSACSACPTSTRGPARTRLQRRPPVLRGVSRFHRECDVPACHMLSMMWGTGWPALYDHKNLHDVTHARGGDLYGPTSMNYYRHVWKMVKAHNTAVKYDPSDARFRSLPDNYFDRAEEIRPRCSS